ncbi:MAG: hypothetical protein E7321_11665 [Clostridiales bacterium]|nr:hypothetical protein [Clostridiales bacterium]
MMTLAAQLCALCAMSALMQLALGDTRCADALGMIGGLLMLHLVISGGCQLCAELGAQRDLGRIFGLLMQ